MMVQTPLIGDVVPWLPGRSILGAPLAAPAWFILKTWPEPVPGKIKSVLEFPTSQWLLSLGIKRDHIWAPTEKITVGRGRNQFIRQRLICPGYLFCAFENEVAWDLLVDRSPRHRIRGVVSMGDRPYRVPLRVLSQMAQMPDRLRELQAEKDAALAALLPKPGDQARLTTGPLAGYMVDIKSIDRGIARFLTLHGVKGEAKLETMERVG